MYPNIIQWGERGGVARGGPKAGLPESRRNTPGNLDPDSGRRARARQSDFSSEGAARANVRCHHAGCCLRRLRRKLRLF